MDHELQSVLTQMGLGFVDHYAAVSGGSINKCFKVTSSGKMYFIKYQENAPANFFSSEKAGLTALRKHVNCPKVLGVGNNFLALEYLPMQSLTPEYEEEAGRSLANLHLQKSDFFGWKKDNFIGSIPQKNTKQSNGVVFYQRFRFQNMIQLCVDNQRLSYPEAKKAESLVNRLSSLLPVEKPVQLHGDFWSGNIGVANNKVYFFDPAVYYGYRECDIAMSRLFGGFSQRFYQSYDEVFPLVSGWEERNSLFQFYPLMVHLYLFGGAYYPEVMQVIRAYS